jgi:hypothetical protein
MLLPKNYPLYDVQCRKCLFRAQVKSFRTKPANEMFGAGWDIIHKTLKSGYLVPALIINCRWKEKGKRRHVVRFYPFVPRTNLKNRTAHIKAPATRRQRTYRMFNYTEMDKLPFLTLYDK